MALSMGFRCPCRLCHPLPCLTPNTSQPQVSRPQWLRNLVPGKSWENSDLGHHCAGWSAEAADLSTKLLALQPFFGQFYHQISVFDGLGAISSRKWGWSWHGFWALPWIHTIQMLYSQPENPLLLVWFGTSPVFGSNCHGGRSSTNYFESCCQNCWNKI